jgi:Mg/Co/Ni transporter MgtE
VIDWAAIQPFGDTYDSSAEGATSVRLRASHEGLHRLRPGELADLLEDLRRDERQELLAALSPDEAADALEEMQADDLEQLLREAHPDEAARLLAAMEPDEAVEALRNLPAANRGEVMRRMAHDKASPLRELLGYSEDEAGGIMTSALVVASTNDTVTQVVDRLSAARGHDVDLDAVAVVNRDGQLVGDLTLLKLLLVIQASPDRRMSSLLEDEDVITVSPHASADEVAGQLVEARRLSLVVVNDDGQPIGRILADDVLDALVPTKGRFHFPRLLS